jgi:hypothetical protein
MDFTDAAPHGRIMIETDVFYNPRPWGEMDASADLGALVKVGGEDFFLVVVIGVFVAVVV